MKKMFFSFVLFMFVFSLSGCGLPKQIKPPTETPTPEATETPLPTVAPTAPPSVAKVGSFYIWDEDYNGKREQLRDAYSQMKQEIPNDDVLNDEAYDRLLEETLFMAAAERDGLMPSAEDVDSRIASLAEKMGGEDALRAWYEANHYSEASFRRAMEREIAVINEKNKVLSERLPSVEQVHVFRISVDNKADLQQIQDQLNMGVDFPSVAAGYEPLAGGDLSWFPKDVLLDKDVEAQIFALSAGDSTDVIERNGRYELYYVADRGTGHDFTAETRPAAEHTVLTQWLEEQKNSQSIERLH